MGEVGAGVALSIEERGRTYWYRSTFPPAASMPAFSASASFWMCPYIEYYHSPVSVRYNTSLGLAGSRVMGYNGGRQSEVRE